MKFKAIISFFTLLALTSGVHAAGDATAGKAKAAVCFSCHGPNGNSMNPVWPKLAGQHASYISKQLADFKAGKTRIDPLMAGQVASLSDQDMADLGAFFAKQKVSSAGADESLVQLGEKIFRAGNKATGVSACMACHGPTGSGNPAASFPRLQGQHAAYTEKALNDFKSGVRTNDAGKMMRNVTALMTEKEIKAVASYIQGLH